MDYSKGIVLKILLFISIIYFSIITYFYNYYTKKLEMKKEQILREYYTQIVEITMSKIEALLVRLSGNFYDQNQDIAISNDFTDLTICISDKCIDYSLIRFLRMINQNVPWWIHYNIKLNGKFLGTNSLNQDYQLERIHYISTRYYFNISLSIDDIFLYKLKYEIKRPFWLLTTVSIVNIFLLGLISGVVFKCLYKECSIYYKKKHKEEIEQLNIEHDRELNSYKDSTIKKIWDYNFNRQKDIEINCLLAQEANKLSLADSNWGNIIKDCRLRNFIDKLSCAIILYQGSGLEEINISGFVNLLVSRFDKEQDNIAVSIVSKVKVVYFSSRAVLCQIIYSLISYLIFMIGRQSPAVKYNINLIIDSTEQDVKLSFEYDGLPVADEKELFKLSNYFFRTHANPFLLNIDQVFKVLKTNGFECEVSYNQVNIINILSRNSLKNKIIDSGKSNVIMLPINFKNRLSRDE